MVQIALLINIKWIIRFILIIFWIIAWYLSSIQQGFITWLIHEHITTSIVLLTATFHWLIEPFYAPLFKVKKKVSGGEVVMEKTSKILLLILAIVASVTIVMFVNPGARVTIIDGANSSVLQPLMALWLRFTTWVNVYPGIYILGAGLAGGLFLALVVHSIALPKIRYSKPVVTSPLQGAPDIVPGTLITPTIAQPVTPIPKTEET